jgi:thioredoxin reductase
MNVLSRRMFIRWGGLSLPLSFFPGQLNQLLNYSRMQDQTDFDVIIIGGSYSGLAAGMSLGRALRSVLIIDSGEPCNRQTPHSHNFLTQDGSTPGDISAIARKQVEAYKTIQFVSDEVIQGSKSEHGYTVRTAGGRSFHAKKLIFATGIKDIMPDISGFSECWGISVLHCPYCHGYEVRKKATGILGNGDGGFEFATLLSNWTDNLTVFTNGKSTLTEDQSVLLSRHNIAIVETEISALEQVRGRIQHIAFKDGTTSYIEALYARVAFEQHCLIPKMLGCEMTDDGFIKIDSLQKTSVAGVFASGDNTSRMRTVANAVAMGTTAGMATNKELIFEYFTKNR